MVKDGAAAQPSAPDEDAATPRDAGNENAGNEEDIFALPGDLRSVMLLGILLLLTFYAIYLAREIVLPIVFAIILKLLLSPAMRLLAKLRVPGSLAALLLILGLFAVLTGLFSSLASPASDWLGKLPQTLPRLEQRLSILQGPLDQLHQANQQLSRLSTPQTGEATPVVIEDANLGGLLFSSTRALVTGFFEMLIVLFFLLAAGDLFLRRLVEVLPRLRDKKRAVMISQEIERHISAYLGTISVMNALVGLGVGLAAYLLGLGAPLLWGAVAFLLNYVPILGPFFGIAILFLASMVRFDSLLWSGLLAAIYLALHLLEGEVVTPMLVARRFTLNPVLVVISLIFWYWMWGVAGAIVAVPLLAITKIICDHIRQLAAIGHVIGG